jgi:hypothetical protein
MGDQAEVRSGKRQVSGQSPLFELQQTKRQQTMLPDKFYHIDNFSLANEGPSPLTQQNGLTGTFSPFEKEAIITQISPKTGKIGFTIGTQTKLKSQQNHDDQYVIHSPRVSPDERELTTNQQSSR